MNEPLIEQIDKEIELCDRMIQDANDKMLIADERKKHYTDRKQMLESIRKTAEGLQE